MTVLSQQMLGSTATEGFCCYLYDREMRAVELPDICYD